MRILLLIIQFPPDVNSAGILMSQVCKDLRDRGHEVKIITTFPHYDTFRVWEPYRGRLYERTRFEGMDILRLYVYAPGNKTIINRLLSYISFCALATISMLLSRDSYDVILCTNGAFITGLAAYIGGLFKRIPYIYNVQDLYPEVPIETGQLTNPRAIKVLRGMVQFMYRKARHLTVITPSMRSYLQRTGVPEEKISVIPNFVDTDFIRPLSKHNDFSRRNNLEDKFVVTYAGNIGYVADLNSLVEAAGRLKEYEDMVFLIIGDGVVRADLERRATADCLDNVRFMPFQPREDLPLLRAASDIQISLYKKGAGHYSIPSKLYELMASGRPLVASSDQESDIWKLVRASGGGLCIEPENAAQVVQAILTLYHDPALRTRMAGEGREYAIAHHSRQAAVTGYEEVLKRLM